MKKEYMKPEVNEITVEANQSIAACGVRRVGYDNSWTRGNNGQFGWPTPEQAWVAYDQHASYEYADSPRYDGPYVFPVYYGEGVDAQGNPIYGTFHDDKNINGVMDGDEYIAWRQGDYSATGEMLSTGSAVVAS